MGRKTSGATRDFAEALSVSRMPPRRPVQPTTNFRFNRSTLVWPLSIVGILSVSLYSYSVIVKRRAQDSRVKARDFPNPH